MAVAQLQKILTIETNFTQVCDHLRDLQNRIMECDNALAKAKADFKSGAISVDEYNKNVVTLSNAKKAYAKEQTSVTKQMQSEISSYKDEIGSINQLVATLDGLKSKYAALSAAERNSGYGTIIADQIKNVSAQIREASQGLNGKIFNDAADSINSLANKLKELNQQYNKLSQAERKGSQGKQLREEIAKTNKEIEREKKLLGDSKKAYGQYQDSVNALRVKLSDLKTAFYNLSKAQRDGLRGDALRRQISEVTKELNKAEQSIGVFGRNVGNYKSALSGVGKVLGGIYKVLGPLGFGVIGVAQGLSKLGDAMREGVKLAIDYNREVSKLAAILSTNANGVAELTAKAKELGSTTRYTAQEVVRLETELAKLGYSKSQILNMTESVLRFGQATGSELANAASLAGATIRTFGLNSTDTADVVDKLSASTTNSALDFNKLATAIPIVGGVAHTFGFKLEEVLSLLAQLSNAGMDASMAATATRNIFLKMADANGELARQLGKPVTNLKELAEGLRTLNSRGIALGDILELVGTRATNSFSIFLENTDEMERLNGVLENCEGTASQMAKTMEDNLGGSLKTLSSVWEDFLLSLNGSQGWLRNLVDWLAEKVQAIGNSVRDVEESLNRLSNNYTEMYSNPKNEMMQMWNADDLKAYEEEFKKYQEQGLDIELARSKATAEVVKNIDKERREFNKLANEKREERLQFEKETEDKYGKLFSGFSSDMNMDELYEEQERLKRNIKYGAGWKDIWGRGGYKEELEAVTKIINLRKEEAQLRGAAEAQSTRTEILRTNTKEEKDKSGLDIPDPKQDQREKSAEKQRLASEQALESQLLKMTQESADKRRALLELKYKQEIQQLKYKIEEELKMRGDESQREYWQKSEAIKNYNKLIAKKQEELNIELDRLSNEEIVKQAEYLKQLYSLKLSAVEEKSNEEFELRMKSLAEQEKAEIAQLELLAEKDATVEEQKEERKLAILWKYALERQKLLDKEKDQLVNKSLSNYQNQILKASNDEIEQARITADMKRYIYDNMYMKIGESEEEFALRQEQAMIELYEAENNIGKKREEAQQRLFQTRMNYANTEIQRLAIDKEAKKSYLDNLSQWLNEADDKFAERKSKAEKDYLDSTRALADAQMQIAASTSSALSGMFGTISQAIEDCGETNEENTRKAKIFGLAEVYITQGMAIAQAIHKAWSTSSNWIEAIAATATGVATVIASTVQAISSIKKAKLAKGAVNIQGQGSETSDSIPAQLSRGESVMTAKATKMFGGLLYAMNKFAAQPNYTLPNMYSTYNPVQTNATNKELSTSMRDAVENIHPVVAVTEINEVSTRLARVKALDNI